jgi:hypothetical protein
MQLHGLRQISLELIVSMHLNSSALTKKSPKVSKTHFFATIFSEKELSKGVSSALEKEK